MDCLGRSIDDGPGPRSNAIVHIRTQARFPSFIDGGMSKTINLPSSSTIADIAAAILHARARGCVGESLYSDGSISEQPSQTASSSAPAVGCENSRPAHWLHHST
ncbi:hypothetical protein PMA4326_029005 (plasmid) [Pseudomonas syringae pv. maculicola str. ES4326]|uniref:Uncharacterized protein n=1 Tax=Pseudomonas syringae pv. maculicola str. ES4326 TaxID=629265 RepID=A0A8T8CCH6_PSEYM|nr:hypothetical protein PMA4326_029005 [Pseudomonas syringae pv. maculicola str. ES4326]